MALQASCPTKSIVGGFSWYCATLADTVVELDGRSIGGVLNASTVAVRVVAEESEPFTLPSQVATGFAQVTASDLGWLR